MKALDGKKTANAIFCCLSAATIIYHIKTELRGHNNLSVNRDEKRESKRRPAGGRRRQGRQQRTVEEKAARAGRWAHAALRVSRGVLDHPKANTLVQKKKIT